MFALGITMQQKHSSQAARGCAKSVEDCRQGYSLACKALQYYLDPSIVDGKEHKHCDLVFEAALLHHFSIGDLQQGLVERTKGAGVRGRTCHEIGNEIERRKSGWNKKGYVERGEKSSEKRRRITEKMRKVKRKHFTRLAQKECYRERVKIYHRTISDS